MTDEERQAATLVALGIYREGVAAGLELMEGHHSPQDEARLKRKVRLGKGAMEDILALHEGLVGWMFERYFKTSFHLKADLMAAGKEGLVKAATSYDETMGRDFGSWAFGYVRGAMLQEEGVDNHAVTLSRDSQAKFRKVGAIKQRLEGDGDGTQVVTNEMVAEEAKLPLGEVELLTNLTSVSLDAPSEDGGTLYDTIESTIASGEDHLVAFATPTSYEDDLVEALLDTLAPDDAKLVVEVVMNETPITEVAARLGVSKQAVSQKVQRLVKKLRESGVSFDA